MIATARVGRNPVAASVGRNRSALATHARRTVLVTTTGDVLRQAGAATRGFSTQGSIARSATFRGNGIPKVQKSSASTGNGGGLGSTPPPPPPPTTTPPAAKKPMSAEALRAAQEVSPETTRKNVAVGLFLLAFAAGTYYYTIHMMGAQDSLGDVEKEAEEEEMIHLHKSKLKFGNPKDPAVQEDVLSSFEGAKEKVKDEASELVETVKHKGEALKDEASVTANEAVGAMTKAREDSLVLVDGEVVVSESTDQPKKKGWRKYWLFGPRVGGDKA